MYPFFELFSDFQIYTFWVSLSICFLLFFFMLRKVSTRYSFDMTVFTKNILWYFLSVYFFSRLFFVISAWNDLKYINSAIDFFIMSDYNFSLIWAIFWFMVVLYINTRLRQEKLDKYIDGIVLAFLFVAIFGFIWAFFGWQVYGKETNFWIEILYTQAFTTIPYTLPIFPLAIVYSILTFVLFSVLYIYSLIIKVKWFIGYIGLLIFAILTLILQVFSGKYDIFKVSIWMDFNQIRAIFLIWFSWYKLYQIAKNKDKNKHILLND